MDWRGKHVRDCDFRSGVLLGRRGGVPASDVRSGKSELRTAARCLLESARPNASEPPGAGLRNAVPHGDFHSFAGAGSDCQEVTRGAGGERKAQAAHRDGNHAGEYVLSRGRISPEVSAEARRSELPLLSCNPFLEMRETERSCSVFCFAVIDVRVAESGGEGGTLTRGKTQPKHTICVCP